MRHLLLFVSLLVPYGYFNHSDGWNQLARTGHLHAIVIQHQFHIDAYHERTGDKALIDGHYYSEKAPAITALALPVFAATVAVQRAAGVDPDGVSGWRTSEWVVTALTIGVLAALGGVAQFALLEPLIGTVEALIATYGLFLGTIIFPYATALFAHAGTVALLTIALWAVLTHASPRRDAFGGLAAGLAVASEYPALLSCGVITAYLAWRDWRRVPAFVLGTLPAVLLLLGNNYLMTGSPLQASYGANPQFPEMTASNLMGFRLPELATFPELLWGEYRGLIYWSPFVLMAAPGIVELARRNRSLAVLAAAGFVITLIQVAAFYNWFGGNAVGPRYLAPGLPFLALAVAYGVKRFPEFGLILAIVSIGYLGLITAIAIDPPGDLQVPLESFYLARIEQSRYADNLGTLMGLPLVPSLLLPALFPALAAWLVARPRSSGTQ